MNNKRILEKLEVNYETGEITKSTKIVTKKIEREKFLRCYVQDMCTLAKCPQSEIAIVLSSLSYLDYETNELVFTAARRKEIAVPNEKNGSNQQRSVI